jgi:hypothetical protein
MAAALIQTCGQFPPVFCTGARNVKYSGEKKKLKCEQPLKGVWASTEILVIYPQPRELLVSFAA